MMLCYWRMVVKWIKTKQKKEVHASFYEIVESKIDEEHYRQGLSFTQSPYKGVIITIHPTVKVREVEDQLVLSYDFDIEKIPEGMNVTKADLHKLVGDAITDMMIKDYDA